MKKQSRTFVLTLALGGIVGVVGLAQQAGYSGPKVELNYLNGFTGPDKPVMDALVKKFNDTHPNITVRSNAIPAGDIAAQLAPQVAAGRAADVVALNEDVVAQFAARRALDELTAAQLREAGIDRSKFYKELAAAGQYDNKTYGIPVHHVALGMYYNKDLMAKMGVTAVPKTRQQFLDAARACTTDRAGRKPGQAGFDAKNLATWGAGVPDGWMGGTVAYTVVLQNGGALTDANNNATLNSPQAVEAVQFLVDLVEKHNVSPANATEDSEIAAFRQGKTCFNFNGVWRVNEYKGQQGLNFGVAPMPRLGTVRDAAWAGNSQLTLPRQPASYDKNKRAAALTFISWLTAPAQNLAWTAGGALPSYESVAKDKSFDNQIVAGLFDALPTATPTAGYPWVGQVRGPWNEGVTAAIQNKKEVKQALDDAQSESSKQIAQSKQQLGIR